MVETSCGFGEIMLVVFSGGHCFFDGIRWRRFLERRS
jgi:hypothetical protein